MTYIKLANYVMSTALGSKRANERLKELLEASILESEEAFNLEFFIEELCGEADEEAVFTLLDIEEVATIKDVDIEYTDEEIDIMVNDILYNQENEEAEDESQDDDEGDDSEDFDEFSDTEED